MKEFKRYLSYIGKYKAAYWSIFIITLITSVILNLTYPYMNKLIFNALEYRDKNLFARAVILCIVLVVLNCLVTVSVSIRINRQIKQMDKDIQRKMSQLTTRLSDILSGFLVLKMYRGTSIVSDSFQNENEQVAKEEKLKVTIVSLQMSVSAMYKALALRLQRFFLLS